MASKKGTDIAPPSDLIKVSPEQAATAYALIRGEAEVQMANPEMMARAIAERIASSDSFEEAFALPEDRQLAGWSDKYMDVPVYVRSLHLNPSTKNEGKGLSFVYAVVGIVVASSGETDTVSCGGYNVLHQLIRMIEMGWTDRPVQMKEIPTANNRTTLYLARVPPTPTTSRN